MGFFEAALHHTFLLNALLMGLLASVACGVVGTYVVARRITYMAGSIAHCVLGGMGIARYLSTVYGWTWLHPIHGAAVAAIAASLLIGWVSLRSRDKTDTVIGAVWAIGMALGIAFISQTPGYNEDLMSYLFGNILMVSGGHLWLVALLDAIVVAVSILFYNKLLAVCFDEEFTRIRGVNTSFYYLLLLCLVGLTVVILVEVVGLVMVIALLTLPVATAAFFTRSLWQTMLLATLGSCLFTVAGLALSYEFDLPGGATIILLSGIAYLVTASSVRIRR
ncbi:MAG: metal ABC transporter permease [candidate division Zixibacteria bacterium]|nr:metal ABC transporter permease [candidate division Zixibacteria bacterium]